MLGAPLADAAERTSPRAIAGHDATATIQAKVSLATLTHAARATGAVNLP